MHGDMQNIQQDCPQSVAGRYDLVSNLAKTSQSQVPHPSLGTGSTTPTACGLQVFSNRLRETTCHPFLHSVECLTILRSKSASISFIIVKDR